MNAAETFAKNRQRLCELIKGSTKPVIAETEHFMTSIDESWDEIPADDIKMAIAFGDAVDSILSKDNGFTNADRSNVKQILVDVGMVEPYDPNTMQTMGGKPYWFVHKKVKYIETDSWGHFFGTDELALNLDI